MRARKVDANQKQITDQLRKAGISVYVSSSVGEGFPDLICGFRKVNYLFELKDGKKSASRKKLTDHQEKFFAEWKGQVHKVESLEQILKIVGL